MSNLLISPERVEGINYFDYSPIAIDIAKGKIVKVERIKKLSEKNEHIFIAPGLIDIQINGYNSVSFSLAGAEGTLEEGGELTISDVKKVTEGLWKEGITTYFPTLTTNSQDLLLKNIAILAKAKDEPTMMGSIAGFHLEGPYISGIDGYRGAHPKEHVRQPDWNEFLELYKASGEKILLVTISFPRMLCKAQEIHSSQVDEHVL